MFEYVNILDTLSTISIVFLGKNAPALNVALLLGRRCHFALSLSCRMPPFGWPAKLGLAWPPPLIRGFARTEELARGWAVSPRK